jgi:sugar fermentation stimulation protein A
VEYPHRLIDGVFLRRYKRFLVDVEVDGTVHTAHLANTGSMRACMAPRAPVRLSLSANPKRKLPMSVEQIAVDGRWIVVNTARANAVVAEGIAAGAVPELVGYPHLRREQRLGDSRMDILLESEDARVWVEVKNATYLRGQAVCFPDARTTRGERHVRNLAKVVGPGIRAVLFFHVGHEAGRWVEPADDIDPDYGRALRDAVAAGVEILAYRVDMSPGGLVLGARLPIRWPNPAP